MTCKKPYFSKTSDTPDIISDTPTNTIRHWLPLGFRWLPSLSAWSGWSPSFGSCQEAPAWMCPAGDSTWLWGASDEHWEGPMARNPGFDPGSLPTFLTRVVTPRSIFFKKGGNPLEWALYFNARRMLVRRSSNAHPILCFNAHWRLYENIWVVFEYFSVEFRNIFDDPLILIQCTLDAQLLLFNARPKLIKCSFNAHQILFRLFCF